MKGFIRVLLFFLFLMSISGAVFSQEEKPEAELKITRQELREIVEESVAMRLRPLQREITELRDETRIHDIMGGVGVIMGLGGVIFYFLGVRKKEKAS